jgi:hypothetical protein
MIGRMYRWVRDKVLPPTYNEHEDDILISMRRAKEASLRELERSQKAVKANQLEAAYLQVRVNGNGELHAPSKD